MTKLSSFMFVLLLRLVLLHRVLCNYDIYKTFRDDFLFGAATSAYQIEGGWQDGGKGTSIWDHMIHNNPTEISDESNADVAADSYHNYERDVEMIKELGLDAYSFSISWPRILPTGFPNKISKAGVLYYNNTINRLLKNNIIPIVTLYHWDLPQRLQNLGGFANPMIAYWFQDYARILFSNFGDRVKFWITFNDPNSICNLGYGKASHAPQLDGGSTAHYLCAKNLVLAHASAYRLYEHSFKKKQQGYMSISVNVDFLIPLKNQTNYLYATDLRNELTVGLYTDPIFSKEGGFPEQLVKRVEDLSLKQGYPRSRLTTLSDVEKSYVQGTYDFFGLNHYTGGIVEIVEEDMHTVDVPVYLKVASKWPKSASPWLRMVPRSLYYVLKQLNDRYPGTVFIVTECGWSTKNVGLNDDSRINYLRAMLKDVEDSMQEGIKVKGFMVWTLMDNFEWTSGYSERFGLYSVDFTDPTRPRFPRKSAVVYKKIIKNRNVDIADY